MVERKVLGEFDKSHIAMASLGQSNYNKIQLLWDVCSGQDLT